jgi:hypothetical protein
MDIGINTIYINNVSIKDVTIIGAKIVSVMIIDANIHIERDQRRNTQFSNRKLIGINKETANPYPIII